MPTEQRSNNLSTALKYFVELVQIRYLQQRAVLRRGEYSRAPIMGEYGVPRMVKHGGPMMIERWLLAAILAGVGAEQFKWRDHRVPRMEHEEPLGSVSTKDRVSTEFKGWGGHGVPMMG